MTKLDSKEEIALDKIQIMDGFKDFCLVQTKFEISKFSFLSDKKKRKKCKLVFINYIVKNIMKKKSNTASSHFAFEPYTQNSHLSSGDKRDTPG